MGKGIFTMINNYICELCDCENQLLQEIYDKTLIQKDISKTYALAIRSSENHNGKINWRKINLAIIERWSKSGLDKIKKDAWSGKCFND